jgi:hypothetical protein
MIMSWDYVLTEGGIFFCVAMKGEILFLKKPAGK